MILKMNLTCTEIIKSSHFVSSHKVLCQQLRTDAGRPSRASLAGSPSLAPRACGPRWTPHLQHSSQLCRNVPHWGQALGSLPSPTTQLRADVRNRLDSLHFYDEKRSHPLVDGKGLAEWASVE